MLERAFSIYIAYSLKRAFAPWHNWSHLEVYSATEVCKLNGLRNMVYAIVFCFMNLQTVDLRFIHKYLNTIGIPVVTLRHIDFELMDSSSAI